MHPYRKISPYSAKLVESYCPGCELLIAASPSRKILDTMEKLHDCPVHFRYPQSGHDSGRDGPPDSQQ
jgi:hypothetical protein